MSFAPFNPATATRDIAAALHHLKVARDLLRHQAPIAAQAVRRALKSTEGAQRHAWCIRERLKDSVDTTHRKFQSRRRP